MVTRGHTMLQRRLLDGQVALVTGSSRGIGRAIALRFAEEGCRVAVTYHQRRDKGEEVRRMVASHGSDSMLLRLDVASRRSVTRAIGRVIEKWGRLDVLVNNAGQLQQKPFALITDADWNGMLDTNLRSVFVCSQEVLQVFKKQKSGCIVNVSSVGGQNGGDKAPHYAAAKAGIISLTKSLARIAAPYGVRVNAVAPGFIRTDVYEDIRSRSREEDLCRPILLGRIGLPAEVASSVVFLASGEASYVTGHVLNVNGGLFLGAGS
jgi:3-oxoacyl-[acyl-carrier protein] reductase